MQNIKMQKNLTRNRITPQGRDPAKYQPWRSREPPQVHSVGLTPPGLQVIPEWLEGGKRRGVRYHSWTWIDSGSFASAQHPWAGSA